MTYLCLRKLKGLNPLIEKKLSTCCIYNTSIWGVMRQMLTTRSIGIYILSMQDYEIFYASILKQYLTKV